MTAEAHVALLYVLRTVQPVKRHPAVISLMEEKELEDAGGLDSIGEQGAPLSKLLDVLGDVGNGWERSPLKSAENREGWEDAVVGCLKDVSVPSVHHPP